MAFQNHGCIWEKHAALEGSTSIKTNLIQMLLVSAPKNVPAFPADGLHLKFRASLGTQRLKRHNMSKEGVEKK